MKPIVPFIDTHIHLDGSLPVETIQKLLAKEGRVIDIEELKTLVSVDENCKDLNEYLSKFDIPLSVMQTPENLEFCTKELLDNLYRQGLKYVELRFAPQLHTQKGLSQDDVVEAVLKGVWKSELSNSQLILCLMRGENNEKENLETIDVAINNHKNGVCAIDLAGAEGLFPTSNFVDMIKSIRQKSDIGITVHAGEAAGAESVIDAINAGADRIGHGVRSVEDEELMKYLSNNNVSLELCPTSNMDTKIFSDFSKYPIKQFLDAGIRFSINTDDMTVSNTTLKNEYDKVIKEFNLTDAEVSKIIVDTIRSTFLDEKSKYLLLNEISYDIESPDILDEEYEAYCSALSYFSDTKENKTITNDDFER